jgi:hypothetical protein
MQSRLRNWIPATLALALATPAAAVECMHPSHVPTVAVDKNEVCWSAVPGARGYDVALGLSLVELGSEALSLAEATLSCLGAGRTDTCVAVPFDPPPGEGFYFTVRANRGNSAGTYETGCPAEAPGRDEAFAAALTCP